MPQRGWMQRIRRETWWHPNAGPRATTCGAGVPNGNRLLVDTLIDRSIYLR